MGKMTPMKAIRAKCIDCCGAISTSLAIVRPRNALYTHTEWVTDPKG